MNPKIKSSGYIYLFIFTVILFLAVAIETDAQRRGRGFSRAADETVFEGIHDNTVLPLLRNLTRQFGGPNVPAEDGRLLYDLIIERGYTRGLEIGTSNGYSGLWIGLALKQNNGTLTTLEIDPRAADEARENFKKAGFEEIIEVVTADALEGIPRVEGTFDFVFIDAHKPDYKKYYDLIRNRMKTGGAITAHNVSDRDWSMADFVEAIQNDPGLETVIHSANTMSVSIVKP
jgi:caffeoyl-CoA O-methyltransferase